MKNRGKDSAPLCKNCEKKSLILFMKIFKRVNVAYKIGE